MDTSSLFRPGSAQFVADPYPAYAELRRTGRALHHPATDQWLVTHHADVSALLRDRRLGRTYLHRFTHEEFGRTPPPAAHEPFHTLNDQGILDLEAPDHTRIRRLVAQAFTPRRVEELAPVVQRIAHGLVTDFVAVGGGDLLADVAEPLPVTVIAEMLGIPEADRHLLRPWSADICGMYELNPSEDTATRAVRAAVEFSEYLRGLIRERRRSPASASGSGPGPAPTSAPAPDLISALIAVHDTDGTRLTEQEMISTCVLLLNAGHEATVNTTANGWWTLFRHPEQLALLRAEPGLLPGAIEELLRYDTPLQLFERWVLDAIEVGGTVIPRGSEVALLFGSANRDPAVFDAPDTFDVRRPAAANRHLSFGAGIHYCLGAPLARVELAASFGLLLREAPRMRLLAEPRWKPGYVIRGLAALEVEV
ncbi:cytochrome P450 [Streptomyces sp. NPDC023838]|uniref:cytochrome P450 n=1 Tax=Streptomyces sp. NPDC023838 TaxID=3154325 RepID=UPI0034035824